MANDITISERVKKIQAIFAQEGISARPSHIAKIMDIAPSSFSRWMNNESEPRGKQKEKVDLLYRTVCEVENGNTQAKEILHKLAAGVSTGMFGVPLLSLGIPGVLFAAGLGWLLTDRDSIHRVLDKATPKERRALAEILESESPHSEHILEAFRWNCQSIFGYIAGSDPSYSQIVQQVAEKLDINPVDMAVEELEVEIARKVLETAWSKMTPEQREEMEAELQRAAQKFDEGGELTGSASIFAALTGAQLSKFGVYLLSSTTLGTLKDVVSVTLPFVVYATMLRAIAVITGPVGWSGAGMFAIWKLTGANYKRLIPAILYVSALRAKQQGNFS